MPGRWDVLRLPTTEEARTTPAIARRTAPLAAALALTLLASACATDGEGSQAGTSPRLTGPSSHSSTAPSGETGSRGTGPSEVDPPVPQILRFDAPLVGGGTLEGAELAGAPVAVWFWAPW